MDVLLFIVGAILATIFFVILNNNFDITYFGLKGIAGTWGGCFLVSMLILAIIGELLGGVLGFLWSAIVFILKIALIGVCIYGIYYGYTKITGKKDSTD